MRKYKFTDRFHLVEDQAVLYAANMAGLKTLALEIGTDTKSGYRCLVATRSW
jgi:hypothetical protein